MVGESRRLALPRRPLTTTATVSAVGPASADQVWDAYTRPARWSEWSAQIRRVDCPDPRRPVAARTSGTVHGLLGLAVEFTVTDVDVPRRRWTWRVSAGLLRLLMEHGVDDTDRGTRAWVTITGPLPAVLGYAPAARWAVGRLVRTST